MSKNFWTQISRKKIINFRNFKKNSHHAYLILGPEKIGKLTLAKNIAQSFLCQSQDKTKGFCGKCHSCLKVVKLEHPDLHIIKPDGQKSSAISIFQIKEIRKSATLTTNLGGFKIFIIDQFDQATIPAQNALLKTLEEPTPKTIFILTASSEKLILPTIISRCQRIKLAPLAKKEIIDYLKEKHSQQQSELIASYAQGRPGLALKLAQDPKAIEEILNKFKEIGKIIKTEDLFYRFNKAGEFSKNSKNANQTLDYLEMFFRDLLYVKLSLGDFLINFSDQSELTKLAQKYSFVKILEVLKKIRKMKSAFLSNANSKLVLENLMLII